MGGRKKGLEKKPRESAALVRHKKRDQTKKTGGGKRKIWYNPNFQRLRFNFCRTFRKKKVKKVRDDWSLTGEYERGVKKKLGLDAERKRYWKSKQPIEKSNPHRWG